MSWQDEFNRRLRVAVHAPADAEIHHETAHEEEYFGYCETCAYTNINTFVVVRWWEDSRWKEVKFDDMGELIRLMDGVSDE